MKKKWLSGILLVSIFGNVLTLQAKTESLNIPVKYNNIKVKVDGNLISTSNEPFIYNGTTYLPVRDVATATGKNVNWDEATKTVNLTSKEINNNNGNNNKTNDKSSGNFGDFSINIRDDFHMTKDYQGRDAICIKYDFTNYQDKSTSFDSETYNKVFQNGIELEKTFVRSDAIDNQYDENSSKHIQKGATILVGEFYVLNDKASDVVVEAKEFLGSKDKIIKKTIKISN